MNIKRIVLVLLISFQLYAQTISESDGVVKFGGPVDLSASPGSRITNTLCKLYGDYHDYETTARIDTVRIRLMGDSIADGSCANTGNSYYDKIKTYIEDTYTGVNFDIQKYTYGGYSQYHYLRYLDDAIIAPKIDLFILAEFDLTADHRNIAGVRRIVDRVRRLSTADIMLIIPNPDTSITAIAGQHNSYYRNIANEYNCELVDIYQAFIDTLAAGISKSLLYADVSHPNDRGHNIYYQELLKRFTAEAYNRARIGYNSGPSEHVIEFNDAYRFADSLQVRPYGTWTEAIPSFNLPPVLFNTASGDSLQVTFTGIGFDLYSYGSVSSGELTLKIDNVPPSEYRINSRPLSYATTPTWDAENANPDRDHRPLKVFVLDTCATGQYTITITNAAGNAYTLTSPTATALGTGNWTADYTDTLSNIMIPGTGWGNWIGTPTDGDKFYFTVKNNWTDTVSTAASNVVKCTTIWGLENKEHTLTIIKADANDVYLSAIRIYRPEER